MLFQGCTEDDRLSEEPSNGGRHIDFFNYWEVNVNLGFFQMGIVGS